MKRIVVALALLVAFEFCSMARIETQKSGKYLAVKFYAPNLESVTEELFIKDYWDAIEFAKAKKCHTISFYGNDGFTFCFIKGYEEIEKADRYLAEHIVHSSAVFDRLVMKRDAVCVFEQY